jgi:hypothetical protein
MDTIFVAGQQSLKMALTGRLRSALIASASAVAIRAAANAQLSIRSRVPA